MRISLTTAKKIRAWSGLRCWPRVAIVAGRFPGFTLSGVYYARIQMMAWVREKHDLGAYEVLARAQLTVYPDAFDPVPAFVLDRLDDLDFNEFDTTPWGAALE